LRKPRKEPYRTGDVTLGRSSGFYTADFNHVGKRKRKRLIPLSETEDKARAALDRFAEARKAVSAAQASHTIGALWALYLAERAKDGFNNDIYAANWVALGATFANRTPDLLKTDDCREYARARFALGRASATVNTELTRLRACLQWAADTDLIAKAPKVWAPSAGKSRDRVLSPDEAGRLIQSARLGDPHIGLFVVLAFATGGRHTAILDLTWDRIDFDAGTIELDVDLPPDPMDKSWRKGRAKMIMSNMARVALTIAKEGRQTDHVIEHGARRLKTVREGFLSAVRRAGLGEYVPHPTKPGEQIFETDITPHTIRHTVASWVHGKVQTAFTAQLLGHRDEATTRKVYTHADVELTRAPVQIIDEAFSALPDLTPKRKVAGAKRPKKKGLKSNIDKRPDIL